MTPLLAAQPPALFFALSLGGTLPICAYIIFRDLRDLTIPNCAVLSLLAVYLSAAVVSTSPLFILVQLVLATAIFALCLLGFKFGLFGGGDAKLCAAVAPFFLASDAIIIAGIFSIAALLCVCLHRAAPALGLPQNMRSWASWQRRDVFPLGLPICVTLVCYLMIKTV